MTISSIGTTKASSCTLETKCGWKGVLKSSMPINPICSADSNDGNRGTTRNNIESSIDSISQTTASSISSCSTGRNILHRSCTEEPAISQSCIPSVQDISLYWMGGEPAKLNDSLEQQGVLSILQSLTDIEREEIVAFDMTVPIRHLRAEKGDVVKAVAQIQKTLAWRKEFGVDVIVNCFSVADTEHDSKEHQIMREILIDENLTGKIYTRGYDQEGRALFYMTPARENTNHELNNMRHLVWNLEKAVACTARQSVEIGGTTKPLEKINLVIDYDAFKLSNAPPMSTTKYTLEILQKHYPERMKHAYLLHPPLVFRAFWALIRSFVDPITKDKIVFCSGVEGRSKLTNNVTTKHKLEVRSYGSDPNIRDFDSKEFVSLPFNVSFDE